MVRGWHPHLLTDNGSQYNTFIDSFAEYGDDFNSKPEVFNVLIQKIIAIAIM